MTAKSRAAHLAGLYAHRAQIDDEIMAIERVMAEEADMLARVRKDSERKTRFCGTESGYYRHIRTLSEPACGGCLMAHARAEKGRKVAREQRAREDGAA